MSDEPGGTTPETNGSPARWRSRRLSFPSRVRTSLKQGIDGVLGADLWWSAGFVAVAVLLLGTDRCGPIREPLVSGQLALRDIRAPFDYDWLDQALTEERRRHARDSVDDVYVHDRERAGRLARQLSSLFEEGRLGLAETPPAQQDGRQQARRLLAGRIPEAALDVLIAKRFDPALERELTGVLARVLEARVVGNKLLLEREAAITLRIGPEDGIETVSRYESFIDLEQARERVRRELAERLDLPREVERALGDLGASFVDANVYYDPEATNERRQEAARAAPPVVVRVAQGEVLARKGERLTAELIQRIEDVTLAPDRPLDWKQLLALVFLASLLAFFVHRYTRHHQRSFRKIKHLHSLMLMMLLSMMLLSKAILWLAAHVIDRLDSPFNQLGHYTYLIPLGAGSILVALLANGRIATVYAAFASLLFAAMNHWDGYLALWAMLVQCAGVYAISTYRERSALLRAGLVVGSAGAASALALEALKGTQDAASGSFYGAALAFLGGAVGVGLLISFSLPLLESLYNVLTDIRLLELSNVNTPLLSEMAVKAPGSYNHSLVVGTLAEEAAKAIGANSLFCRVAAFYHDVGKMNKPEYYVENQRGINPHDRLSPSMSALIIASHVKDGIKMAREARLPEQIVDIIPQHHGTKLMTYFYEKAKSNADPSLGAVKQEDFRYPGPRPQTREAAIFMLADGVEAAARTIEDPTPNRMKEMIRKVTHAVVLDGQLHSCDLTFADLEKIQDAFLRCLVSMYHHRVDYPGFEFGRPKSEGAKAEGKEEPRAKSRAASEFEDRKVASGRSE